MTRICVGRSRKFHGSQPYSSEGFSCTVETETEVHTVAAFQGLVRSLFEEVQTAVDTEVARRKSAPAMVPSGDAWWNGANGGRDHGGTGVPAMFPGGNGNGSDGGGNGRSQHDSSEPISTRQARYLVSLAVRKGIGTKIQLASWLGKILGHDGDLYTLTRSQASRAIDALRMGDTKGGNGR